MKFGVFFIGEYHPEAYGTKRELYEGILAQTVVAEECGFDSAWFAEHHFHPQYGVCPSPPVLIGALSQRTTRIRLGVAVSLLPFHNPIETAEQYAMVDVLTGGRLAFGVGRGYIHHEYAGFDLPYEESRQRFLESLEVIAEAWKGERFSYSGTFHRFRDVALNILPLQRPAPRTYVAAVSPESFELAARLGHAFMIIGHTIPVEVMRQNVAHGYEAWSKYGRAPADLECVGAYHAYLDESPVEARRRGEEVLGTYYRLVRSFEPSAKHEYMAKVRAGYGGVSVDEVYRSRSLMGSPDEVIERVEFLAREIGISEFLCICNTGALRHEETIRTLRLMGERVIPHFRAKSTADDEAAVSRARR